jgi:hypothetical protein
MQTLGVSDLGFVYQMSPDKPKATGELLRTSARRRGTIFQSQCRLFVIDSASTRKEAIWRLQNLQN